MNHCTFIYPLIYFGALGVSGNTKGEWCLKASKCEGKKRPLGLSWKLDVRTRIFKGTGVRNGSNFCVDVVGVRTTARNKTITETR